jgi:hypothetical protein
MVPWRWFRDDRFAIPQPAEIASRSLNRKGFAVVVRPVVALVETPG